MDKYKRILHELVLNWKLRLIAGALLSMLGLAFMTAMISGYFVDLTLLDQTTVGVSVFIVMIPIYLIIADLPKIDEHTITGILNESIPEFNQNADLILKSRRDLSEEENRLLKEIETLYTDKELYRYLPLRPLKQAVLVLIISLSLTAGIYIYFL